MVELILATMILGAPPAEGQLDADTIVRIILSALAEGQLDPTTTIVVPTTHKPQPLDHTYDRVVNIAKETNKAQPVLFVNGNMHAGQVASWLSSLKANNIPLPFIIDLKVVDKATRMHGVSPVPTVPFLQTIHAGGTGYGSYYRVMEGTSLDTYVKWLQRSKNPLRSYQRSYNRRRFNRRYRSR